MRDTTLPLPLPLVLGLCASLSVLTARRAEAADAYEDALARAAELEGRGRLDEAGRALDAVLPFYPQDYALPLQIAWIHYRAGRFAEAERFYRIAAERGSGAFDALLGLGLSLERQGRCDEARPLLQRLAAERPDAISPEALGRCAPRPSLRVTPSVSLTGQSFPGHPYKSLAGAVTAGLGFAHEGGFFLGATYRYSHFSPPSGATVSAWDQHDGYLSLGYQVPRGGVLAHYAVVHDGSGSLGTSHHVGISARWSPFGDIELRASGSFYDDMKVLRVEPSWKIPIAWGISIRPALAVEDAGGSALATGMATLALDRRLFNLYVGGKYGSEIRPVLFSVPVVYDILETISYGAWAGGGVNVTDDVGIHLSYAMDRLKQMDGTAQSAHAITAGAAVSF
jgi:tetratricopeptide (TPR) repeat protein